MVEFRIRRSRLMAAVSGTVLLVAALGVGSALANHDAGVIHACANNQSGSLRLVDAASDCRNSERAVEWSRGGSIPIPQACPTGQFVTGIDSSGQLTCAVPGATGGGVGDGSGGGGAGELRCTDSEGPDGQFETPPPLPNASGACNLATGEVRIGQCYPSYHDLNGIVTDGCEYGPVTVTGPEVCDGLDNDADGRVDEEVVPPPVPNGSAVCQEGVFVVLCSPGFSDANAVLSDGCEVTDP